MLGSAEAGFFVAAVHTWFGNITDIMVLAVFLAQIKLDYREGAIFRDRNELNTMLRSREVMIDAWRVDRRRRKRSVACGTVSGIMQAPALANYFGVSCRLGIPYSLFRK